MTKWKVTGCAIASISFCVLIAGCQSGNTEVEEGGAAVDQKQSVLLVAETPAQQDALDAFNRGDKRLLGVQTRGVSVPGVDEKLLPVLRERYGVALRHVNDVIKNQEDRDSITEAFQYVREYNGKMAELLSSEL